MMVLVPQRNWRNFLLQQLDAVLKGLPLTPAHDAQSYETCLEPPVRHSQGREADTETACRYQYFS